MTSFFTILKSARARKVLSEKAASQGAHSLPLVGAGVDKLNAYFAEPLDAQTIINQVKAHGIEVKRVLLDRKPCLRVGSRDRFAHLYLSADGSIRGLSSNPNRFNNWQGYIAFLESILTPQETKKAKISRVDLNIDFACPFSELIQQIDVKNKSTELAHEGKGGERTGIYIGKEPELLLLYDKAKKDKLSSPCSRIELRLSRKKTPCSSIYEVPKLLKEKNYFENIEGVELTLSIQERNPKYDEFKTVRKRDGLYAARKAMNKTRNFDRDFANLIKVQQWSTQPNELFKREIKRFLGTSESCLELVH